VSNAAVAGYCRLMAGFQGSSRKLKGSNDQ